MGSGEEEDDGGLTPTEDEDDVQRPSGPPESVSAHVNRGYHLLCPFLTYLRLYGELLAHPLALPKGEPRCRYIVC